MLLSLLLSCTGTKAPAVDSAAPPVVEAVTYQQCFPHIIEGFGNPYTDSEHYPIDPTCSGTSHQDFSGIDHVIFLGDSITVGTYPTPSVDFYRNRLAAQLAEHYGLTPPEESWQLVDYETDQSQVLRSGDFSSCARLGARTSELHDRSTQLQSCFTEDLWDQNLLVIMTMGGNDLSTITQDIIEGQPQESIWRLADRAVRNLDQGFAWLREPRFTGRLQLVFSNLYEFTDGTGDAAACPMAEIFDLNVDVDDPFLEEIIIWLESQYFELAKRYDFDMLFMQENFCGHGFHNDNPDGRCYLGPNTERWFDNTCLHPNPTGHAKIAELFWNVITAH